MACTCTRALALLQAMKPACDRSQANPASNVGQQIQAYYSNIDALLLKHSRSSLLQSQCPAVQCGSRYIGPVHIVSNSHRRRHAANSTAHAINQGYLLVLHRSKP